MYHFVVNSAYIKLLSLCNCRHRLHGVNRVQLKVSHPTLPQLLSHPIVKRQINWKLCFFSKIDCNSVDEVTKHHSVNYHSASSMQFIWRLSKNSQVLMSYGDASWFNCKALSEADEQMTEFNSIFNSLLNNLNWSLNEQSSYMMILLSSMWITRNSQRLSFTASNRCIQNLK